MTSSVEMRAESGKLIDDAESIIRKAETEQRTLTDDETNQWNALVEKAKGLKAGAETVERKEITAELQAEMRSSTKQAPHIHIPSSGRKPKMSDDEYGEIVRAWAGNITGRNRFDSDLIYRAKTVGVDLFSPELELRATLNTSTGGDLIPTLLDSQLTEKLHFFSSVRQVANVVTTDGGGPIDHARYDYTAEASIIGEEPADPGLAIGSAPTIDKVTTTPWHYATGIQKISYEEIQDANTNVVDLITTLLGGEMARGQETDFIFGTGSGEPQGLDVATTVAVTLDSSNTFNPDVLADMIAAVPVPYRVGAQFMMNDATLQLMRKSADWKDGVDRPLWQPDYTSPNPNRFYEYPIVLNSKMYTYAEAIAASGGHKPFIYFGNFQNYRIRDVGPSRVLSRYNELFARTGQVGFSLRMRTDGKLLGHSGCIVNARSH